MTKFSTLAYSVLLIVLVAFQARANTCVDLFRFRPLADEVKLSLPAELTSVRFDRDVQTSADAKTFSVRIFASENASPRVKAALADINKDWRIVLDRAVTLNAKSELEEATGFTPWSVGATIHIPRQALKSEDALATYLEHLVPLVNEAKRMARIEENSRAIEKLDPATKRLLTNWFTKNEVRVQIKSLAHSLGESSGMKIMIDETLARYPRVIGTVAHEIYHTTVSARLTPEATATEISRAIWYSLAKSDLPQEYARMHRADEYEARIKQMAILRHQGLEADAANIKSTAETFRVEQKQATDLFLEKFDDVVLTQTEDPGNRQRRALKLTLGQDSLYVPLVRRPDDLRAYAREALEKRSLRVSN